MRVAGEVRIAALLRERRLDLRVDAEIEHRIQHSGHAHGSAGADRQQQRSLVRAEAAPRLGLQQGDARVKLVREALRQLAPGQIGAAGLGGHHEGRRHREARVAHDGDAPGLAADQRAFRQRGAVEGQDPTADGAHGYS